MSTPTKTVSVRFSQDHNDRLTRLADHLGVSVSEYLRDVVAAHLEAPDTVGLGQAVQDAHEDIRALRGDVDGLRERLALAVETILVNLTDGDEHDIADLVHELRKP